MLREFIEVDNDLFRVYIFCHTVMDRLFTAVIQKQYKNEHIFKVYFIYSVNTLLYTTNRSKMKQNYCCVIVLSHINGHFATMLLSSTKKLFSFSYEFALWILQINSCYFKRIY